MASRATSGGKAALLASKAGVGVANLKIPRKWTFEGDSLTAGTGATLPWTYPKMVEDYAGSANVLLSSVNNGVGGTKLAAISTALQGHLPSYDGAFMLGGTNDATGTFVLATSTQGIIDAAAACRAAKKPLVVGSPPPFYNGSFNFNLPQYQQPIIDLNTWILANAATYGFIVADFFTAMKDTDGQLLPAYRFTDGEHINSEGYSVMAKIVTAAIASAYLGASGVRDHAALNLCSNPGNAGAGTVPTGATLVTQTGTASGWTTSYVADGAGILVPGSKWFKIAADATAGVGVMRIAFAGASLPNGDIGSFRCKLRLTDASGNAFAGFRANSGFVDFGVGKANIIQGGEFFSDSSSPYEVDFRYTATSTATHTPFLIVSLAAGQSITVEIGDIGLFDMTANPF